MPGQREAGFRQNLVKLMGDAFRFFFLLFQFAFLLSLISFRVDVLRVYVHFPPVFFYLVLELAFEFFLEINVNLYYSTI